MKLQDVCCLSVILFCFALSGCASFSSGRSAQVDRGLSCHIKAGATIPPSRETWWFWDIGSDCPLCYSKSIPIAEVGLHYGFKLSETSRPFSIGLLVGGDVPQAEIYAQLHEGEKEDYGIGGRLGLLTGWYSHQLFFLYDRQLGEDLKLLINPGLFYHTGQSPNGANTGSLLFFTQSVGLAFESDYYTFTPCVSLIAGKGKLSIASMPPTRKFSDTFVTAWLGITFHKKQN